MLPVYVWVRKLIPENMAVKKEIILRSDSHHNENEGSNYTDKDTFHLKRELSNQQPQGFIAVSCRPWHNPVQFVH